MPATIALVFPGTMVLQAGLACLVITVALTAAWSQMTFQSREAADEAGKRGWDFMSSLP